MSHWFGIVVLIILTLCIRVTEIQANESCTEDVFSVSSMELRADSTRDFISYLRVLIEGNAIGDYELNRFASNLKEGVLVNPIDIQLAKVNGESQIYYEQFEQLISLYSLDLKIILSSVHNYLRESRKVQFKRSKVRSDTDEILQEIKFSKVSKGRVIVKRRNEDTLLAIPKSIDVMTTNMTQSHWLELMGENPSFSRGGPYSILVKKDGKLVKIQPNHPVENINWWSVLVAANNLSEKYGLKPVYDLSRVHWNPTTAAKNGNLVLWLADAEIKINAPDGDYYRAEGIRLPTVTEQEYLTSVAKNHRGGDPYGEDGAELENHAWYYKNSGGSLQPVADKDSLIINDHEFYDLFGNVAEWGFVLPERRETSDASIIRASDIFHSLYGGSYIHRKKSMFYDYLSFFDLKDISNNYSGVRFVRSLNPGELP